MADRNYLTVSELNFYLKNIISNEELLSNIFLVGEISGLSVSGKHAYFTLKDTESNISVCFFNCVIDKLPKNGDMVLIKGAPNYYEKTGKLSFLTYSIEHIGLGKLQKELDELKEKLKNEGLFDAKFKKILPKFSKNICLITSLSGAVIEDMMSTIRKYNDYINIAIVDIRVQGVHAVSDIIAGLRLADRANFDVIILARGGGSFEELLPFSDEKVARTIFELKTPIISAVGHETDNSVADMVADVRALTPTAAAELVAFDVNELKIEVMENIKKIRESVQSKYKYSLSKISYCMQEMRFSITNKINYQSNITLQLMQNLKYIVINNLERKESEVKFLIQKLDSLSPLKVMMNGYFKVQSGNKLLSNIKDMTVGKILTIYGHDGHADVAVVNTVVNKE